MTSALVVPPGRLILPCRWVKGMILRRIVYICAKLHTIYTHMYTLLIINNMNTQSTRGVEMWSLSHTATDYVMGYGP